jgi:hypothetical protein
MLEVSAADYAALFYANDPDFLVSFQELLDRVSRRKKSDYEKARKK